MTNFLRSLPGFLLLCLAGPALATETLVFCLEKSDVRPWRTQEGGGLNIELLNRVAQRLGIRFEYAGMPWKRCLAELKTSTVSGTIGASFKAERVDMGAYPGGATPDINKRLNTDRYVILKKKGSRLEWDGKTFHHLDGPVGIQLGYSVGEPLRALGAQVDEGAQKPIELARKLAAGRLAAAAMLDGEVDAIFAAEPKLAVQLEEAPLPLVQKPYFLMFSYDFLNNRHDLALKIWNTIEDVRKSAEYQKLEHQALKGTR